MKDLYEERVSVATSQHLHMVQSMHSCVCVCVCVCLQGCTESYFSDFVDPAKGGGAERAVPQSEVRTFIPLPHLPPTTLSLCVCRVRVVRRRATATPIARRSALTTVTKTMPAIRERYE